VTDTFFFHIGTKAGVESEIPDEGDTENSTVLGVDPVIDQIALTLTGMFRSGHSITHRRREYERVVVLTTERLDAARVEAHDECFEQHGLDVLLGDELGEGGQRHRIVLADAQLEPHVEFSVHGFPRGLVTGGAPSGRASVAIEL
jgi:hypothetical protein